MSDRAAAFVTRIRIQELARCLGSERRSGAAWHSSRTAIAAAADVAIEKGRRLPKAGTTFSDRLSLSGAAQALSTHNPSTSDKRLSGTGRWCGCWCWFRRWRRWSRLTRRRSWCRSVDRHLDCTSGLCSAAGRPRLAAGRLLVTAGVPDSAAMPGLRFCAAERHAENRNHTTHQGEELSRHGLSFRQETFAADTSRLRH